MQFQQNPFGQLPQFGQQQPMDPFAGGGGFAGQMGGMMPSFLPEEKKKKKGMNPLTMLALMSQSPLMGGIGIANLLGAFK